MNEDDVVQIVRAYVESLFPKVCSNCGRRFGSLREYLHLTTHVGSPIVYESLSKATLRDPLGPMSHANCPCGTTLTIDAEGLPRAQLIELMDWARRESERRSISVRELLRHLRDRIDTAVLQDDDNRR